MKIRTWVTGAFSALLSFIVLAATDETQVKSLGNAEFNKELTSSFSNLTPEAIEAGLRDLVIIGSVAEKDNAMPKITWHSISKKIGSEEIGAKLTSPLGSPKVESLPRAGETFNIEGDLDSLLADYRRMMAKNNQNDITLKEEKAASSNSGASSSGSGGYFDGSSTQSPDTGGGDFVVKPDTTFTRQTACDIEYDYDTLTAHEREKTETVSNNTGDVISSTDCARTTVSYPIQLDYSSSAKCSATTDYINAQHYFGFKYYVDYAGNGSGIEYISDCKTDLENPVSIYQDISDCGVSENLTTFIATINKKWAYNDKGMQVFVSDCMPSNETYPIVEDESDCVPFVNENLGTVYSQSKLIWVDGLDNRHAVTECRPSTTELQTDKEFSGELEHDYVGGVSYEISRDYYVYNGDKYYLNDFSRDPTISYPHYRTTDGCTSANDDANLRSRLYEKTFINRNNTNTVVKECTASGNYVPYTYIGDSLIANNILANGTTNIYYGTSGRNKQNITNAKACEWVKARQPQVSYQKVTGNSVYVVEFGCNSNGVMCSTALRNNVTFWKERKSYKRFNNTTYTKNGSTVCRVD